MLIRSSSNFLKAMKLRLVNFSSRKCFFFVDELMVPLLNYYSLFNLVPKVYEFRHFGLQNI
jgi:hypothetical protein